MALKSKYGHKIDFIIADVDKEPELTARYQVDTIPVIYLLDGHGNIIDSVIGYVPQNQLEKRIEEFLDKID